MSHIYIAAMNAALKKLTRVCSKCGLKQTVKRDQHDEVVVCTSCGAQMRPRTESGGAR